MKPAQVLRKFWNRGRLPDEVALVARGASHTFFLQGLGLALGYGVHVALARWMGAAEYGIYTYVLAWASLLAVPAGMGLPLLVVRFVPAYRVQEAWGLLRGLLGWGWRWMTVLGFGLALAVALFVLVLDASIRDDYVLPLLVGVWLIPLQAAMRYASGLFQAFHRLGRAYALPVLRHTFVLGLAFFVTVSMPGLTSVQGLGVTVGALALALLVQVPSLRSMAPASVQKAEAVYAGRAWLRVSCFLLLVGGFLLLLNETDILMVGTLLGPREAGIYRAASKTASLVAFVLTAAGAAAAPMMSTLYARGELDKLQRLLSVLAHWIFWPSLGAGLFLTFAAEPVLRLFGPEFVAGRWLLTALIGGQLVNAGAGPAAGLLSMTGHQDAGALALAWGAGLNIALNAVGVIFLGAVGAALATALSLGLVNVVLCRLARRRAKVNPSIVFALRHKRGFPGSR
jgi:O-antigen/teichoic acid export membrane protein